MEQKTKIIYKRENLLESIIADIASFGVITVAFWFNYTFINGNNWLDALLFISFFLFAIGKAGQIKRYVEIVKQDLK